MRMISIHTGVDRGFGCIAYKPPLDELEQGVAKSARLGEGLQLASSTLEVSSNSEPYTQMRYETGEVADPIKAIQKVATEIACLLRCGGEVCVQMIEDTKRLDEGERFFEILPPIKPTSEAIETDTILS